MGLQKLMQFSDVIVDSNTSIFYGIELPDIRRALGITSDFPEENHVHPEARRRFKKITQNPDGTYSDSFLAFHVGSVRSSLIPFLNGYMNRNGFKTVRFNDYKDKLRDFLHWAESVNLDSHYSETDIPEIAYQPDIEEKELSQKEKRIEELIRKYTKKPKKPTQLIKQVLDKNDPEEEVTQYQTDRTLDYLIENNFFMTFIRKSEIGSSLSNLDEVADAISSAARKYAEEHEEVCNCCIQRYINNPVQNAILFSYYTQGIDNPLLDELVLLKLIDQGTRYQNPIEKRIPFLYDFASEYFDIPELLTLRNEGKWPDVESRFRKYDITSEEWDKVYLEVNKRASRYWDFNRDDLEIKVSQNLKDILMERDRNPRYCLYHGKSLLCDSISSSKNTFEIGNCLKTHGIEMPRSDMPKNWHLQIGSCSTGAYLAISLQSLPHGMSREEIIEYERGLTKMMNDYLEGKGSLVMTSEDFLE